LSEVEHNTDRALRRRQKLLSDGVVLGHFWVESQAEIDAVAKDWADYLPVVGPFAEADGANYSVAGCFAVADGLGRICC
jgi:hypothetical protein